MVDISSCLCRKTTGLTNENCSLSFFSFRSRVNVYADSLAKLTDTAPWNTANINAINYTQDFHAMTSQNIISFLDPSLMHGKCFSVFL